MKPSVLPDIIWQELESGRFHSGEDFLSERHVTKHCGTDIFLGLIAGINERTVHLRIPQKQASDFYLPFAPSGLWVKSFVFADHTMLAVVLTDDELQLQFSQFAVDFIRQLNNTENVQSILSLLAGELANWQSASTHLRRVA